MNLSAIIKEYQLLLEAGKNFGLIDKFYDDEIMQVKNNEPPVKGKNVLREIEKIILRAFILLARKLFLWYWIKPPVL